MKAKLSHLISSLGAYLFKLKLTRNLAIANRSSVSCAHNTSRASRPIVNLRP